MGAILNQYRHYFILALLFLISEIIVDPRGEFPLNDDWAYTKSVLFLHEGKVDIGEWPAMTLISHLLWGFLFTKTLGFSFFALRLSVIISSLAGILVFFALLRKWSNSVAVAFSGAMVLLFSPLYFNLSNTFMTDVSFNTLLIFSVYAATRFFESRHLIWFVLVIVLSLILVLMRQFGIIVPACFFIGLFFLKEKKWHYLLTCAAGIVVVYAALKGYESYLKAILPATASYKFSGGVSVLSEQFRDRLLSNIIQRHAKIFLHLGVYIFPFVVLFLPDLIRQSKKILLAGSVLLSLVICACLFYDEPAQMGNVFEDMSLGAETWYETLNHTFVDHTHTWSPVFAGVMNVVKILFSAGTLLFLLLALIRKGKPGLNSRGVFGLALFFAYLFMILITESYFDRYHIPLIALGILLLSCLCADLRPSIAAGALPILFFIWISVFGTKDYFTINRVRWQAYHHLHRTLGVPTQQINAGFEVNCWNEGLPTWWQNFLTLDHFNYLIQYQNEPEFKKMKHYPFQRYFPFKKDTVTIFERETKIAP